MKLFCVYSTLAAPVDYALYQPGVAGGQPIQTGSIVIKGGAGVANSNLVTPRGVATMVTDEQIKLLKDNPVFKLHEKNGYVTIEEAGKNPEDVAANMEGRDNSAPLVPQDYEAAGQTAPVVNTDTAEVKSPVSGPGHHGRGKGK